MNDFSHRHSDGNALISSPSTTLALSAELSKRDNYHYIYCELKTVVIDDHVGQSSLSKSDLVNRAIKI